MSDTEVRVVLADAVVVGPEDRLVISIHGDPGEDVMEAVMADFKEAGFGDRVFIISSTDPIEFAKVEKE